MYFYDSEINCSLVGEGAIIVSHAIIGKEAKHTDIMMEIIQTIQKYLQVKRSNWLIWIHAATREKNIQPFHRTTIWTKEISEN